MTSEARDPLADVLALLRPKAMLAAELRAHGEPTVPSTLAEERATNPFMRAHSAELVASVRARMPEVQTDPVGILGAVRALKDKF